MNLINKYRKLKLLTVVCFVFPFFNANAAMTETKWTFSPKEIIYQNYTKEAGDYYPGGGTTYACSFFQPSKVTLQISYDPNGFAPTVGTGGTGTKKIVFKKNKNVMLLKDIEMLDITFWNGSGIYKVENISNDFIQGLNCEAGFSYSPAYAKN